MNPAVSPKLANETISKALKRATCHLWTVRAVMIGCMGVVIKESSCCSVENPKMQNGPLHDRASILHPAIRIGPVYMQHTDLPLCASAE
jgi:hypothetical protein